ncbi:MAG TPA: efflux RND transporter periplasmic adaptor subunit [Caldithrix abyssi]|uniref:Efflux RND transporter periplasmic adaptor subunit n=1 Tax=Caldithrix abyssi TaxID=187145 RepID=A0A7V5VF05_CALAY|nr:efflux RND transporter periplasmic adaptor subunit [Caldithrix abyssi]
MRLALSLFIASLLAILSQSCASNGQAEIAQKETGVAVRIMRVEPQPFVEYIHTTGTVKAQNQIRVVAEEAGILKSILFDKGRSVKKDAVLAVLENNIVQAAYRDAEAALEQARINEKSARTLKEKEAISDNDFQLARLNRIRAEAARDIAATRREKLNVTAPISGYVNERFADLGAYISPGTPLFEIVDLSSIKIVAGIAERFFPYIKSGTQAEVSFDAYPLKRFEARITFVARSIDPQSRTFNIELELPRSGDTPLSPQMMANIRLTKRRIDSGMVIPLDAIIESENGRFVFLRKDAVAKRKPVTVEAINGDRALVGGLQPGEQLVIVGQRQVSEGDTLNVIQD